MAIFNLTSGQTVVAPIDGDNAFGGGGAGSRVVLNGNVYDYTLSREQRGFYRGSFSGEFILTATNGSGVYSFGQSIDTIQFQNGQYLSLKDVPAYVKGDSFLNAGDNGVDDLLYQERDNGFQIFSGFGGNDRVLVKGNVGDYTLRPFSSSGVSDIGYPYATTGAGTGLELVSKNGSGSLFISDDIETVQFQSGQYLSYGDLHSYVAPDADQSVDQISIDYDRDHTPVYFQSQGLNGREFMQGNPADYHLERGELNSVRLVGPGSSELFISAGEIYFQDGQHFSLGDLPDHISSSDDIRTGTDKADLLIAGRGGDQYIVGGDGDDGVVIHGNTYDYTIRAVDQAAANGHPAVNGVELVAKNGGDNLYIDQSTETVRFQNGQQFAFDDLPTRIERDGSGPPTTGADNLSGTSGDDTIGLLAGNDTYSGGDGADLIYGNQGNDLIYGNTGRDSLYGGMGDDRLYGGMGDDTLQGGIGNDTLQGGRGADIYRFGQGSGADVVLGYSQAEGDSLDFQGQASATSDDGNGGTLYTLQGGGTVDVAGLAFHSGTSA